MNLLKKIFGDCKKEMAAAGTNMADSIDRQLEEEFFRPIMSDDLRNAISHLKGEIPGPDLTAPETRAHILPLSAEDATRKRAEERALVIGHHIQGKGIFVGMKDLKDRNGNSLGVFNIFAAPEDAKDSTGLSLALTFNKAVRHVADLRHWHGCDGGNFMNDTAFYTAISNGRYQGEWVIPPQDILVENLYHNKDKGALQGALTSTNARGYLSCTEPPDFPFDVLCKNFTDGKAFWEHKFKGPFSLRPVRMEWRSPAC